MNVGIVGYGNLGKALEDILINKSGVNLVKIFSRRENLKSPYKTSFDKLENISKYVDKINTLFLCVGSYSDVEKIGKVVLKEFNTIDSFDTHSKLKDYILILNEIAKENKKIALSAFGWDPGLMSLIRVLFDSISVNCDCNCFWGSGVSQGHSDALRRVEGVENAIQYTVPQNETLNKCKHKFCFYPLTYDKHKRICYVSVQNGFNTDEIKEKIISMPNYFKGYKTEVNFVDEIEIKNRQKKLKHKGYIIKNFKILNKYKTKMELILKMDSNPHFTAEIMAMGMNIVNKLYKEKKYGAYSILDVPISYFSIENRETLLSKKL